MIKKAKSLSALNFELRRIHNYAGFRVDAADDRVTALGAYPSKATAEKIAEGHRDLLVEYTGKALQNCREFLGQLKLVKTGKYYAELHKYDKVLKEIKENPEIDKNLLEAARKLFDAATALWQVLQDYKQDFDAEKRKTFLKYYLLLTAPASAALFWVLGDGFSLDRRVGAVVVLVLLLYAGLKRYFKLEQV